jgi:RNA polymerase nonessential primary-like sigma factor
MLSLDEQALLESVENDEWQSVPNREQEIQRYQSYARSQLLEEISRSLELSRERIRQIEAKALQKLHQPKRPNEV